MNNILVTGADGFVGNYLLPVLSRAGYRVRGSVRALNMPAPAGPTTELIATGAIGIGTDWTHALRNIDCIVHLAGRAHVMQATEADALPAYRAVNVDGSARLAQQAAALGVKRFIYLSSIKVNGERTFEQAFRADDPAYPEDAYGQSKWEAEQALRSVAGATGLELVIIRPPLIYGPGVKGNLLRLLRWTEKGWPLPCGSINNARSLIGLGNLCDLLRVCIEHPLAAGEVFLAADGDDLATPQLLRLLAHGLGRTPRVLPFPLPALRWLGRLAGIAPAIERLSGDLRVDIGKTRTLLEWAPPYPVATGLTAMCEAYLQAQRRSAIC